MEMETDKDLVEVTLNRADLKPRRRLDALIEKGKITHINPQIAIWNYIKIGEAFLASAKNAEFNRKFDSAIVSYLHYTSMLKNMKTHPKYSTIPIGERCAFDYKLKAVLKIIEKLSESVLLDYKKFYRMSRFDTEDIDLEGYKEQRPTVSTVRTFVSGDKGDLEQCPSQLSLLAKGSAGNRFRTRAMANSGASMRYSTNRALSSQLDYNKGLRRSIFPTKQMNDFDIIHSQRRIVRSHKTVVVPSRITTDFSYLSYRNTKKNIETVAFLAGKELNESQYVVSHMIFPQQIGYSDYFKIKDSVELTRYLDQHDLLTLGWIHSHPLQSNYLSSCDMHYHSIFQSVLPEAIAIVFSPKYMNSATFNLTPNHGLKYIMNCREKGFHAHPTSSPLTMISQHAVTDLFGDLVVEDFRGEYRARDDSDALTSSLTSNLFQRMIRDKDSSEKLKLRRSEVNFVHIGRR